MARLSAAGLVVAATVVGAGSAAAAPAAGYTASYIQTGMGTSTESVGMNSATNTIYFGLNSATGHDLAAMDGSSRAVNATVPLAEAPLGIAVDSATNTVYVAGPNQITVINGATNSISATIALPAGADALGIAVDSATDTIYVANARNGGGVFVIDGSNNTISTTVSTGSGIPLALAVDESADVVWVANGDGPVLAISGATDSIIYSVSVTTNSLANSVAVNPLTDSVYVSTNVADNQLTVIDGATGTITTTVPMEGEGPVVVDPSADTVFARGWATIGGSTVGGTVVIDGATNTAATVIGVSGSYEAVDPSTGALYEASPSVGIPGLWAITPSASNAISPLMSGPVSATASVGVPFGGTAFIATGLPTPTLTKTGTLPVGITLNSDGVLSGTPAAGTIGVYPITLIASNGIAPDFSLPFTLTVTAGVPVFTSPDQVIFHAGVADSFTVTATGEGEATFSYTGAVLPAGVTLSSAGVLSGTPVVGSGGRYPIQITASNAAGTATQAFTLIVDVPGAPPPAGGVLGDVTGDGLADILAIDLGGNLWLYPNTGSGDAGIFAAGRSQVGQGWTGYTLAAVVPLYGSARAGILAKDPAGNLWYYPNTGGSGSGTFGARSEVGMGWNGHTVVGLTDLYGLSGEGVPGILAIDPAGNLWYYPGTGGTGTATFGARSLVGTGWTGYTADIYGLGILAVDSSGTMWLYPSGTGTGTSTFGSPSEVSTGWSGYQAIDVGVLTTGSSGADILGIDPSGNLWYYPSTSGTFGTPVQVGTGWTGYHIN